MELKWLEDLIALAETDTLAAAAIRRNLSQPAFSRRVQAIEAWVGAPILDRTRRPARLADSAIRKLDDIRSIASQIRRLRVELQSDQDDATRVVIAATHSIAVGFIPQVAAALLGEKGASVLLKAADRDECYSMLMTRQVGIMFAYDSEQADTDEPMVERVRLGGDELAPFAAPHLLEAHASGGRHPAIVAFPPTAFLGAILHNAILPRLPEDFAVSIACETALAPSALEFACLGAGIAWLPSLLVRPHAEAGRLARVPGLPSAPLDITAWRIRAERRPRIESICWDSLVRIASAGTRRRSP